MRERDWDWSKVHADWCAVESLHPCDCHVQTIAQLRAELEQAHKDIKAYRELGCSGLVGDADIHNERQRLRAELEGLREKCELLYKVESRLLAERDALAEKVKELEQAHVLRSQLFDSEVDAHRRTVAKLARAEKVLRVAASNGRWATAKERALAYFATTAKESTDNELAPADGRSAKMSQDRSDGATAETCTSPATAGSQGNPLASAAASSPTPKKETCDLCDEKWTRGFWDGPTLRFLCTPHDAAREQAGEGER